MLARAIDAGAGDETRVAGQAVLGEDRAPARDHVLVEDVDVLEVEPGAQAILAQRPAFARQCADEIAEGRERLLRRRVGGHVLAGAQPRRPQMALVVALDQEIMLRQALLADRQMIAEMIGKERELGAAQRRLLDERDGGGAVRRYADERAAADALRLVHRIADEDPPEDRRFVGEANRSARRCATLLDLRNLSRKAQLTLRLYRNEMYRTAACSLKALGPDAIGIIYVHSVPVSSSKSNHCIACLPFRAFSRCSTSTFFQMARGRREVRREGNWASAFTYQSLLCV